MFLSALKNFFKSIFISQGEINRALNLSPKERYEYFIETVAKNSKIWVLHDEERIYYNPQEKVFYLWPSKKHVKLCALREKSSQKPISLKLKGFLEIFMASLSNEKIKLGIFETPVQKGFCVSAEKFEKDLKEAIRKFQ